MMADIAQTIHVLGAAIWVGGMFFALLVLRPSLGVLEPPQRLALHMQVFCRFFLVVWHAMPLVLATGYAMLFARFDGFAQAGPGIHAMHLLGLIMGAVFLLIFFGPWARLRAGETAALDTIRKLITLNLTLGLLTIAIASLGWR